jgi:AraC-like DNA-binding protein
VQFSLSFYALLPFLTLLQALLFSVLLLWRGIREERHSDFRLLLLLLLFGLSGVPYMLGMMGINYLWEVWPFYPWQYFGLAIPPSIYLFLQSLVNSGYRFRAAQLWHYAPYLLNFVYHLGVGMRGPVFARWWQNNIDSPYSIYLLADAVELVQHLVYLLLSIRLYRRYREWIGREFSDLAQVEYAWFRNFLFIFALKTLEVWVFAAYYLYVGEQYDKLWWGLLADTVMVYFLSIFGYAQPYIRSLRFQYDVANAATPPAITATGGIQPDPELETWKARVIEYFEREQPWLDPELTLSELAARMKTNPSVLSQVINSGFGKNFNDFVNGYRVEAFKKRLDGDDARHLTLLAIALDCGFNSKATFNRAFKKLTGFSPKEFVAQRAT